MKKFFSLTRRNCLIFLRDKGAVFFSLLSMLIVLMLMGVFLGNMNEESVVNLLNQYGGARNKDLDAAHAKELVQYWTLAGILIVNAVTVTLTVLGNRVSDLSESRLASLYSAPVSQGVIALSYVASAVLVGVLMCMLTLGAALCYIAATGGTWLTFGALAQITGLIVLNVCVFAVVMYFFTLFVKSSSAWSGIGTVVGTLVGFVGAIYLPMGNLPEGVVAVLKYIPILHGASLMRTVCCEQALETTFAGTPAELLTEYREYMGITVEMGGKAVDSLFQVLFLAGCGIIAFILTVLVQKRKDISDR